MPEVSFYLLPSTAAAERLRFACKLLEKAYRSGQASYVLTDGPSQSQAVDDLLWTFRAASFVPHQLYHGDRPHAANAVLIGQLPPPEGWRETVLNLSGQLPEGLADYGRILEILDNDEQAKALARERYRRYQRAGIAISTHKMEDGPAAG